MPAGTIEGMTADYITWTTGGAAGWTKFGHGVALVCNFKPDGPRVRLTRTAGRHPVGTIAVGEVVLTIRPGETLIVPDRMRPDGWTVSKWAPWSADIRTVDR